MRTDPTSQKILECLEIALLYVPVEIALFVTLVLHWI